MMTALCADGPDVIAAVVGEIAVDPHEVHLAVGMASERRVGDRDQIQPGQAPMLALLNRR